MTKAQKISVFLLRISVGWVLFYGGLSKILAANWSPTGYIGNAKTLGGLYGWLALPQNAVWVNLLNEWGVLLLGAALIFGILTRPAAIVGLLLMVLYYLPAFSFPYASQNSFIIDEHVVYFLILLFLIFFNAGKIWGLDGVFRKSNPKALIN